MNIRDRLHDVTNQAKTEDKTRITKVLNNVHSLGQPHSMLIRAVPTGIAIVFDMTENKYAENITDILRSADIKAFVSGARMNRATVLGTNNLESTKQEFIDAIWEMEKGSFLCREVSAKMISEVKNSIEKFKSFKERYDNPEICP